MKKPSNDDSTSSPASSLIEDLRGYRANSDSVPTRVLAEWLGITSQAVNKHARDGVLKRSEAGTYDLRASVLAYCRHIREVAAGRGGDEQPNLTAERARLAKEQADSYELKNAVTRGELVEVAEAERAWSDTLRTVRSCMLAVPSRVRQRLGHLTIADIEAIDREVRDALMEAAGDEAAEAPGGDAPAAGCRPSGGGVRCAPDRPDDDVAPQ